MNYEEFLEDKSIVSHEHGLTEIPELHASMFPHQRDVTQWALRLGKSAAFLGTGLGKTLIAAGLLMFGFVAYQLWGTGIETARAQNALENEFEDLLAGTTPTDAIEITLLAAGIGPGDKVITVANTVTATVSAIVATGAKPVFVDIEPGTMLLDVAALETMLAKLRERDPGRRVDAVHGDITLGEMTMYLVVFKQGQSAVAASLSSIGVTLAALSGVDNVSGPGMLDFESCQSLEKLVVDNEACGMAQRLMVARAVMHRPAVLFLDEPTAGLDPQSRIAMWESLGELHGEGQTILLTTHYMEEAEALCNRIAILNHGEIIACDTLQNLLSLTKTTINFSIFENEIF